jgi:hypothetical protein
VNSTRLYAVISQMTVPSRSVCIKLQDRFLCPFD